MENKYLIAYDIGTTGNKAALYDLKLNLISSTSTEYPIYYPQKGYAEQDPDDFWNSMVKNTKTLLNNANIPAESIRAIICDCQMNSTIPIDKDGNPLMNCISWLDTRSADVTKIFRKGVIKIAGFGIKQLLKFIKITGGAPGANGKDPISHILWLKKEKPDLYINAFKFLSVKDFIIYRCTGSAVTSRDLGNTSWMMDTNPENYNWSDKILTKLEIDKKKLPMIKLSTEIAGTLQKDAADQLELPQEIPMFVGAGDIAAAAIGSGAIMQNQIQICLGTADWIGSHIAERKKDLVHYTGSICSAKEDYLCLSKQETGASCLDWLIDIAFQSEVSQYGDNKGELYEYLDKMVVDTEPGSKDLLFCPWLFGERSPLNDPNVRGGFYNLGLNHGRKELLRSVYEGIAFNIKWGLKYIEKLVGRASTIRLTGGGGNSKIWCQILADVTNREIQQVENPSLASARGAAVIALVGLGILNDFPEAIPLIKLGNSYIPNKANTYIYDILYDEFLQIYKRNKEMFNTLNAL